MEQQNVDSSEPLLTKPKLSYWRRLGGGSLTISIIVHAIFLALGLIWVLSIIPPEPEKVVEFKPSGGGGNPNANKNQKKQTQMIKNNLARVAAKDVSSNFVLPDPEKNSTMTALGALGGGGMQGLGGTGSGGGQGSGIGTGFGGGMGSGVSKGGPVFFGQEMRAQRVVYVIDFSISMRADGRDVLMREELAKSVKGLPDKTKYQLIFFSGPVWVAGDEVANDTVKHDGKSYSWSSKTSWEWVSNGPLMKAEYIEAGDAQKKKSLALIKDTELVGGTDWEAPLEIAMNMEPPPEVIFFMTDGAMEGRDMARLVRGLTAKAKSKNIKINAVNMMVPQPEATEAMNDLASKTGGKFTIVEKGGRVRKGSKADK